MTAIPHIDASLYDYELPDERIAKYPLHERDKSKLLIYNTKGEISESTFNHIRQFLPEKATLVFNNTKVIRARLKFSKETGAAIEIFCLEPLQPLDIQQAFATRNETTWKCIVGNSKKWKNSDLQKVVSIGDRKLTLTATRVKAERNSSEIHFAWDDTSVSFAEIIENVGVTPIPPYLNRETEAIDNERYQTVYSEHKGSVAAPTAGLHFTKEILAKLQQQGIDLVNLTLHVGAGTFKPVQTKNAENHVMHTEHFVVEREAIERILNTENQIVAVGTTSVRTLESLYWLGVKLLSSNKLSTELLQWEAYELPQNTASNEAFAALLEYMKSHKINELHGATQIMIVPGYRFRVIDALITNFHQPHSTLLLLIGALVDDDWRRIYQYALDNNFRFLSYGDSSLLFPKK